MKNETEERKMGFIGKREVSCFPPLVDAPDRLPLVVAPGRPTLLVAPVPSSLVNLSRHATCRLLVERAPQISAL